MKLPPNLMNIPWMVVVGDRAAGCDVLIDGRHGWVQTSPQAVLVACELESDKPSPSWLRRISLLLAGCEMAGDDNLLLERDRYWLCRRYSEGCDALECEMKLFQQCMLARYLGQDAVSGSRAVRAPSNVIWRGA